MRNLENEIEGWVNLAMLLVGPITKEKKQRAKNCFKNGMKDVKPFVENYMKGLISDIDEGKVNCDFKTDSPNLKHVQTLIDLDVIDPDITSRLAGSIFGGDQKRVRTP